MAVIVKMDNEKKPDRMTRFFYYLLRDHVAYGQIDEVLAEIHNDPDDDLLLKVAEAMKKKVMGD